MRAELPSGEGLEDLQYDGKFLSIASPRAFPPGAPVQLTLSLPDGVMPLEGRSVGSKRRADERFVVRLRLINLRREDRQRLENVLP